MRTYDFSPMFRYSVGFDRMQRLMDAASARTAATYPPYNIETDSKDTYRITVAVAGFDKNELDMTVENGTLTITGNKADEAEGANFLHRGIAGRDFRLQFSLAEHIEINGANLKNGVLVVDLEREVPEELKPRQIEIKNNPVKSLAEKAKKMIGADKKAA